MILFKCKMCGGTLEFEEGAKVGVCDSCGTKQTLPRLDDDRRANLYDRANHFRRNNEFDKAAGIYEQILNEDNTDAEAYWSLVLCRYGIEYVEDPATHKRVPTVNRTQYTSIFDDDNYKSALRYADESQRVIYEEEAAAINEIQKGILAISQKEEPFDVFICYKETDQNGRRTQDSVLANDLYHQLTQEGFKVFFSRITLEDKLGIAYEPYIFAALNSSKVMVVLGTRPEHFNAVWVKNEWSRYLALVKESSGKKVLIPAYRDMDPYDLPEEFSHLQAQDMSKLGFMQDLIRGIKKITKADEAKPAVKETAAVNSGNAGAAPLLRRAFMFLEDGDWEKADEFCEQVLNLDPENQQAYIGKLMAELHVRRQEDLQNCRQPFDTSKNYQKAIRFGDKEVADTLKGYITYINDRNENERLTSLYNQAVKDMNAASSEVAFKAAADEFKKIPGFNDADTLARQCLEKAEVCRKDAIYESAKSKMIGEKVKGYETAISSFQTIPGWKDADKQIEVCQKKIEEIKAREEAERLEKERKAEEQKRKEEQERIEKEKAEKKRKKVIAIVSAIIIVCAAVAVLMFTVIIPKMKFNKAKGLIESGEYDAAYELLEGLGDTETINTNKYDRAMALIESGEYDAAYELLEEIGDTETINANKYDGAMALIESGDYENAINLLINLNYKDSLYQLHKCYIAKYAAFKVGDTIMFGSYEQDNNDSNGKEAIEWIILDKDEDNHSLLLLSKFALDSQQYENTNTMATWETSSLREWLNGDFLEKAFSNYEQNKIINTVVTADKNPKFNTSPGINTNDKIFLLSIEEVNKYTDSDDDRKCIPTEYAIAQGVNTNSSITVEGKPTCWWWLRSPGTGSYFAAVVHNGGNVYDYGDSVDKSFGAVRPALWIDLGS